MAEGKEPSFGWLVVARAWADTLEMFEATGRTIVVAAAIALASLAGQFLHNGKAAMITDLGSTVWQTVLPIAAVGFLILLWNLWLAPAALAFEEARKALAQYKGPSEAQTQPVARADEPVINWAIWKHRGQYSVYEFAKILAKTDPAASALSREGAAYARLILEEIEAKKLAYIKRVEVGINGRYEVRPDNYTEIPRDVLLVWAKEKSFSTAHIE